MRSDQRKVLIQRQEIAYKARSREPMPRQFSFRREDQKAN